MEVTVRDTTVHLDTLNGFYCLDDIYNGAAKPNGMSPRQWLRSQKWPLHTVQIIGDETWARQEPVYEYATFLGALMTPDSTPRNEVLNKGCSDAAVTAAGAIAGSHR